MMQDEDEDGDGRVVGKTDSARPRLIKRMLLHKLLLSHSQSPCGVVCVCVCECVPSLVSHILMTFALQRAERNFLSASVGTG